jgi:hypothetical protein
MRGHAEATGPDFFKNAAEVESSLYGSAVPTRLSWQKYLMTRCA